MKYSLITPCKPAEYPQLLSLKHNLDRQNTHDFEWIIALNGQIDFSQPAWQADYTIQQVDHTPATLGAARNAGRRP